jgi:hypothetical protein
MRILHRLSIASSPAILRELAEMGLPAKPGRLLTLEVDESHESWPALQKWVAGRGAVDIVETKFSAREVEDARLLELVPESHQGYPQPQEDFAYREKTFDLTRYCARCGIGMVQNAPFQLKSEPRWGNRSLLQLNWVFDVFFARTDVWAEVLRPLGVASRSVTDVGGHALETVVQLVPSAEVDIVADGLPSETCERCNRVRYFPVTRGHFPAIENAPPDAPLLETRQYFGSGAAAHRRVVVSQLVARALRIQKVRGASFRPVADS